MEPSHGIQLLEDRWALLSPGYGDDAHGDQCAFGATFAADRGSGRRILTKELLKDPVHTFEVLPVMQQDGNHRDVGQITPGGLEDRADVADRLTRLLLDPPLDELPRGRI